MKEYSSDNEYKINLSLVNLMIVFDVLFIINIALGVLNILQRIELQPIKVIYYSELSIVALISGLSLKYINDLYTLQKFKLEKCYSIFESKET
jgi:hypothetical protein